MSECTCTWQFLVNRLVGGLILTVVQVLQSRNNNNNKNNKNPVAVHVPR